MEKTSTLNTYKAVFDHLPAACILLKPDHPRYTIIDVNQQYIATLRWPDEQFAGKSFLEVLYQNLEIEKSKIDRDTLMSFFLQAINKKCPVEHDVLKLDIVIPDSGEVMHKYWTTVTTPILNDQSEVEYLFSCPTDVTVQHELADRGIKLESAARIQREFFESVFMQAPVGIGVWEGPSFITRMINPALSKFYKTDSRNLIGRPIFDAFPESGLLWKTIMTHVLETREPYIGVELAVDLQVNDTVERSYVNFGLVPYYEANGSMSGVLGVSIDATQQVALRKDLEKSELIMKIAVESAGLGIWDLDLKTRKVFSSSHIWIAGFPMEQSSYLLDEFLTHVIPEDRNLLDDALNGPGSHFTTVLRTVWSDNSLHWIQLTGNILRDENEQRVRVVGTTLDITDRKELEQRKDELLSTVSHELKTPVTSIKAIAQLLERKFEPIGDRITVDLIHKLVNQIKRLTNLIHDLLDASLIEGGKLQLNKNHFHFNELLDEVISDVQRTTNTHKIVLQPGPSIQSFSDKERIRQVIINMLTNAIKYSPTADEVLVSLSLEDKCIRCCVEDFGVGIPKEKESQIFERFYRVIDDKHSGFQGIGIGLYISKQIITRLNGKIWFEGKADGGTIFCFEVPQF